MATDRVEEITSLLIEAGRAHKRHQQTELHGEPDKDWARWYAGYAVEQGISAQLGHAVSVDSLVKFFTESNIEYQRLQPTESWAAFTAQRMADAL